jgi:flagellar assembly factor FliW
MKQTAVQWLIDELTDNGIDYLDLAYVIINQAKEMEKQQIMEAYDYGQAIPPFDYAEKYYNETYKKP